MRRDGITEAWIERIITQPEHAIQDPDNPALTLAGAEEGFMPSSSPVPVDANEHYRSQAEYVDGPNGLHFYVIDIHRAVGTAGNSADPRREPLEAL